MLRHYCCEIVDTKDPRAHEEMFAYLQRGMYVSVEDRARMLTQMVRDGVVDPAHHRTFWNPQLRDYMWDNFDGVARYYAQENALSQMPFWYVHRYGFSPPNSSSSQSSPPPSASSSSTSSSVSSAPMAASTASSSSRPASSA